MFTFMWRLVEEWPADVWNRSGRWQGARPRLRSNNRGRRPAGRVARLNPPATRSRTIVQLSKFCLNTQLNSQNTLRAHSLYCIKRINLKRDHSLRNTQQHGDGQDDWIIRMTDLRMTEQIRFKYKCPNLYSCSITDYTYTVMLLMHRTISVIFR